MLKKIVLCVDRLHWLWVLLSLPLYLFPMPQHSIFLLIVPALWGLDLLLVYLRYKKAPNYGRGITVTPLNLPILLLLVMVLVSVFVTYDLRVSLPKIAGVIAGVGVFYVVVREAQYFSGFMITDANWALTQKRILWDQRGVYRI